jgi:hypothetical protein
VCTKFHTDGGSHFVNEFVAELLRQLAVSHHVTVAYAPWSNAIAERVCKELRGVLSAVLFEAKLPDSDWPFVLPVVNSIINQSPSTAIAGYSPIEVFTGLPPTPPLTVIYGHPASVLIPLDGVALPVQQHVELLRSVLHDRHLRVIAQQPRRHGRQAGEKPVNFGEGSYVLIARTTRVDKTRPKWEDPARVVAVSDHSDLVFSVQNLATGAVRSVHARHLKLYADKDLLVTQQLLDYAAYNGTGSVIETVLGHRHSDVDGFELLIKWELESVDRATWEPLNVIYAQAPLVFRRYVRLVQDRVQRDLWTAAAKRD